MVSEGYIKYKVFTGLVVFIIMSAAGGCGCIEKKVKELTIEEVGAESKSKDSTQNDSYQYTKTSSVERYEEFDEIIIGEGKDVDKDNIFESFSERTEENNSETNSDNGINVQLSIQNTEEDDSVEYDITISAEFIEREKDQEIESTESALNGDSLESASADEDCGNDLPEFSVF